MDHPTGSRAESGQRLPRRTVARNERFQALGIRICRRATRRSICTPAGWSCRCPAGRYLNSANAFISLPPYSPPDSALYSAFPAHSSSLPVIPALFFDSLPISFDLFPAHSISFAIQFHPIPSNSLMLRAVAPSGLPARDPSVGSSPVASSETNRPLLSGEVSELSFEQ